MPKKFVPAPPRSPVESKSLLLPNGKAGTGSDVWLRLVAHSIPSTFVSL